MSLAKKTHFLSGLLVFGTVTAVSMKMQLEMSCKGYGGLEHTFDKPFFQSIAMFVAMFLALPLHFIILCIKSKDQTTKPLLAEPDISYAEAPKKEKKKTNPLVVAIPALFDLIASTMMTFGLIYISVSVFQMLRGSMVIFSTILTRLFLPGRRIATHQLIGVFICFIALCMVGTAGVLQPQANQDVSIESTLIGVALVVGSQIIQAAQLVIEEFLLKDLALAPMAVVGYEGLWGTIMMVVVACPLAYVIPGKDFSTMAHNSLENTIDSFICLGHEPKLIGIVVLFCGAVLLYNCYGMLITDSFSAINRTIFEACRTACIWIVDLIIHAISPKSPFGELWSRWSWVELAGFVVLVVSSFVYNGVIKIPGVKYEKPKPPTPQQAGYPQKKWCAAP